MTVWPVRPNTTSTPSRSRYSVSRYAANRVSLVVGSGSGIDVDGCAHGVSRDGCQKTSEL